MATTIVANDVSAVTPEIWSTVLQDNLYKSLVSQAVANVDMSDSIRHMDVINKQYVAGVTAAAYTPGTTVDIDELDFVTDQLNINEKWYTAIYVDDVEQLQANIDIQRPMLEELSYTLKDKIDTLVLNNTTAGTTAGHSIIDGSLVGDNHSGTLTATTANILQVFAGARTALLAQNCEDVGDFCAVISPAEAFLLQIKGTGLGFNFADAAVRNGYIGDFMGFQIYVSNNLTKITDASASFAALTSNSNATVRGLYFGRKGRIELALQAAPKFEINKVDNQIGHNIICWTVWGDTVYTRNKSRFLNVITNITARA